MIIVACSTGIGGAISIVRLSGAGSKALLDKCFKTKSAFKQRTLCLGQFDSGKIKDKAMAVFFEKNHSYTGEEMVELNLHGGRGIVEEAVEFFIKNGARLAQNGEFTKRAFLNGRLDLSAAEGVLNLINSQTSKQAAHAFKLHDGVLKGQIDDLKEKLLEIIAALSAAVDYPEEDIEQETIGQTKNQIEQIFGILQRLEDSYKNGKLIKDGVSIAIIGDVNVGKSQLINALTRSEAAIVSDIAGTTRDIVKDFYNYQGYKFVVFDCAGIRKTSQKIERIGIERAKKAAMEADIVLVVFERECGVFSGG
ncbi:MAG: tRNA uridine-5-carboxymethylaminomethyl(34) synthesis GTPase MnmE, partial [Firmicutes bacterium]|nr:tRNA uridine-5-carboxymethylaminomethyl(34) synthesis GTPase MnmE [Bacillota bacterium]